MFFVCCYTFYTFDALFRNDEARYVFLVNLYLIQIYSYRISPKNKKVLRFKLKHDGGAGAPPAKARPEAPTLPDPTAYPTPTTDSVYYFQLGIGHSRPSF